MSRLSFIVLAAASLAGMAQAASQDAPFTIVESGKSYWRLDDAVNAVGDRDATIRIALGVYRDCAIQQSGRIAFVAAQMGTVVFDGTVCEGKAALVLRGRGAAVDGIVFRNMRVPDGNGAGIRLERGPLEVKNAMFRDSEEGILTADDPNGSITVDHSTFSGLGRCDRGLSCAHGIYVGHYGSVTVTNSRFERGTGGHYFKSRAARNDVRNSSFDDSKGLTTNYMIDLCAGSIGTISGNIFVQGPNKENHSAFITVAAEARENPSRGLSISGNTASLAPGVTWPTVFVADWSHEPLALGANTLAKGITPFQTR
jgi:hypothetical protein